MPVTSADRTPWTLIAPVLAGESPESLPTVATRTRPDWDPTVIYADGDRVVLESVAYEARWWPRGDVPGAPVPVPGAEP